MKKYKILTWLATPLIAGCITFLLVSCICLYAAWSLNGHRPLQITVVDAIPFLLICVISAIAIKQRAGHRLRVRGMLLRKLQRVHKSEKRNVSIVRAMPDLIFVIDRKGRYIDFNDPRGQESIVDPD